MHLKSIYIDNFKNYRKVTINFDQKLNVFTGINNTGKTTILEAVALWSESFRILITRAKRSDARLNIRQGDYRLGNKVGNYVDHRKITSVRTSKYEDIFFGLQLGSPIKISVTVGGLQNNATLEIPIVIRAANGSNYDIVLDDHDNFNFSLLNSCFNSLPTPFSTIYASPVASLVVGEQFKLATQINHNVLSRQSYLVLRNRIFRLRSTATYNNFESDISYILNNSVQPVVFHVIGDINLDCNIDINVQIGSADHPKDISLLGSGTLQIIELMLALYEGSNELNLVLLDEPDSHIHRDIQKRLIRVLQRDENNAQIFITTHNESLLRSTSPNNIFHIQATGCGTNPISYFPIVRSAIGSRHSGIQPSHLSNLLCRIVNENSLDLLDIIEARKVVFVEGDDDAHHIRKIFEKATNRDCNDIVFWAFGGIDAFLQKIRHYKSFLEGIGTDQNIWSKCIAIFDCDFVTSPQINALANGLRTVINLESHIWQSYTFESSILSDRVCLQNIFYKAILPTISSPNIQTINDAINDAFSEVVNQKTISLNSDLNFQNRITGQIESRARHIEISLGINNIIQGGAPRYFINYSDYARGELQAGRIQHLCNKDDVESIIINIEQRCGYSLNVGALSRVDFLIDAYDQSIGIPTWREMVMKLI
jgi:hypothetical protein